MKGTTIITGLVLLGTTGLLSAQVNYMSTQTNNLNSSALGLFSIAQGYGAFASGYNANSSGFGAHALGMNAQASGIYSLSAGTNSFASGAYSLALGKYVKATEQNAAVLGSGFQTYYLVNNKPNSMMIGFLSDRPTLFVGSSSGAGTIGKIGIGTDQPLARLDIQAENENGLYIYTDNSGAGGYGLQIQSSNPGLNAITILHNADTTICLRSDGRLYVDNTLTAKEVKVRMDIWKDQVFRNPGDVMALADLKSFITTNHHLPGIPSEAEVLEKGINIGVIGALLLEKIEELTLYVLQLEEGRKRLENQISDILNSPNLKDP